MSADTIRFRYQTDASFELKRKHAKAEMYAKLTRISSKPGRTTFSASHESTKKEIKFKGNNLKNVQTDIKKLIIRIVSTVHNR